MKNKFFYYTGAIHIHSKFSDGTGDINEISKSAKDAGLDWIIITDHNSLDVTEGFYNGVCVIIGEEISPETSDHYLALGINTVISPDLKPCEYIDNVRKQGGFGYCAHPDESSFRKNKSKPIKWTNKTIVPDGVEIWNWFSDWADSYDETSIFSIAYSYLFKHNLIKGPHQETLEWWDVLNKNSDKIIPAAGGVDAHALKISKYIIPITVFPYKSCFKTIANIIPLNYKMPETFEEQKNIILNSLRCGKNIIINRYVKDEIPFIFVKDKRLYVKVSVKSMIKLIHNGILISSEIGNSFKSDVLASGKYRVEIYLDGKPWIYSNPFII